MAHRTLHYVADPMCSWCWGFRAEFERLRTQLPSGVALKLVLGGLAVDSADPMPQEVREHVQQAWREVEERTGAEFNWSFWQDCEPRRSTYPACRAVVAAGLPHHGVESAMFEAIQRAYYLEARNPSLDKTLIELAGEIGLNASKFAEDLSSQQVGDLFRQHRARRRALGVDSFPSLVLEDANGATRCVMRGSGTAREVLAQL